MESQKEHQKDDPENVEYFQSYENFEVHRLMLDDKSRTEAYMKAILTSRTIKDKVVMDVGAGTGILSLFCAKAGAKKVYAVEASDLAVLTKQIVQENQLDGVIEVLHSKVEDVSEDIKVDVLISEWMGFYLLHESMLDSVIIARDKHLKSDGVMYPDRAILKCSPCSLPGLLDYWQDVYGYKMNSIKKAIRQSLGTKPEITILRPEDLLSVPREILNLDLMKVTCQDISSITARVFQSTNRKGLYQGVALWFDVAFPDCSEVLSTGPFAPTTHWKQTVIVWPQDQQVEDGDILAFQIQFERFNGNSRKYAIHVEELDACDDAHPVPCDCGLAKCKIIQAFLAQVEEPGSDIEVYSDEDM